MLAKMIDKIVSLKETKTFEIGGQTYTDGNLTRIPPHVDRPEAISVSGLDGVCKLIRTELEKVGTTIMVQAKSYKSVEVMTTYLPDFSRNILYRAEADAPGIYTGFRSREVALIELRSLFIPNEGTAYLLDQLRLIFARSTDEVEEEKLRRLLGRLNSYAESNLHKWLNGQYKPGIWSRTVDAGAQPREGGAPDE